METKLDKLDVKFGQMNEKDVDIDRNVWEN